MFLGVRHLEHTKWIALAAVAVKLPHIMLKAVAALRCWVLDMNTLMTIAVAGAARTPHCCTICSHRVFDGQHCGATVTTAATAGRSKAPLQLFNVFDCCAGAIAIGQYTEAGVVVVLFCVAEHLERNCR